MRRWNGWGDDTTTYPLTTSVAEVITDLIGPSMPPRDVSLADVVAHVPVSRLPAHPLVSTDAADRLRHARGQSFPDLIALRSGQIPVFPDGVAYPLSATDVRALLHYAATIGARLIPYGGGTSVVGHITPQPGAAPVLTVDMRRMNRLLDLDTENQLARFGAGVAGPDLEAQLQAHGYTLGHYPQSKEGELERVPGTTTLWAELRWAARHECVVHLDDLLLRRMRLGVQVPQGGAALLPQIRGLCQEELGWDETRWLAEEAAYLARWRKHYSLPDQAVVPDWHAMLVEARHQRQASLEEQHKQARQSMAIAVAIGVLIGLSAVILRRRVAR